LDIERNRRGEDEVARESQGSDAWPTILWIAWRAGDTERLEPLCRIHREHVFKRVRLLWSDSRPVLWILRDELLSNPRRRPKFSRRPPP
jgi:hypothetical protein